MPKTIEFIDAMPHSAAAKINRRALVASAVSTTVDRFGEQDAD